MTPEEAANVGLQISMKEHRNELFAAIRNNTPYIAVSCPQPIGYMGYLPRSFDSFFERYGDRPLIKGETIVVNKIGTHCVIESWNKASNPSDQRKMDSNQALANINKSKTTCIQMGFVSDTDRFADCVLRVTEMQSNNSPKTVIHNNTGDSSVVRALLEEQEKQRQLEGSIELIRSGMEMLSPPKPKLTCKYNTLTKTTVCN